MKSGRMRWAGHVARMGWMRNVYNFFFRKREETTRECLV